MTLREHLKDEPPHYRRLFAELCKRVGAKLEDIELKKDGERWAFPHGMFTWTKEEGDSYEDWLVDYVYKYRRKLGVGYADKKIIRDRYVSMFLLQYSWKYK